MKNFKEIYITIYNNETGEIIKNVGCPVFDVDNQINDGESYLEEKSNDFTQYVNTKESPVSIANKPNFPGSIDKRSLNANGIDSATIYGLPDLTIVEIADVGMYEVTDGIFEFTIDTPGTYVIKCFAFPYLDGEFKVNAS